MKKIALAAAVLALAPMAQADLLFTVGAKASVWNASPAGQIDDGVSIESKVNGVDLGSDNGLQTTLFFEHPLPFIPNFKLKNTALELDGSGNLTGGNFGGQPFNEDIKGNIDLSHSDLTLYWGLPLPLPYIDINFGLTARQFSGDAQIVGKTSGISETVDLDMTVPMGYAELKVGSPFGIYAAADINYIGFGDNKLTDMSAVIGYDLPVPIVDLGLELGYRSMKLETDKDDVDVAADLEVKGLFFGASLAFGF